MNHFISLATAGDMTLRYRTNKESVLKQDYQDSNLLPICETFDKAAFEALLAKTDCMQIRIYYGMDESLKIHAIIVAADGYGNDILPGAGAMLTEGEDIVEAGNRCPDLCPDPSPLNS